MTEPISSELLEAFRRIAAMESRIDSLTEGVREIGMLERRIDDLSEQNRKLAAGTRLAHGMISYLCHHSGIDHQELAAYAAKAAQTFDQDANQ